jgi:hypothetical protein
LWFNKLVFDWNGSGAKCITSDIEDLDSGIEEAILQMDVLYLEDDDDNMAAVGEHSQEVYLFLIYSTITLLTLLTI